MSLEDQTTDCKSLRIIMSRYPDSSSTDINRRIGAEISARTVKRALDEMIEKGKVTFTGSGRWRKYRPAEGNS
jgi:ATP-dependent DNA helicase RecG